MSVDQFLLSADTTDLNYPEIRPTLDLNFARTKVLDPRITFTRSSGGSYVGADGLIKYAGVNEARFDHDPVTGESLGLLIEEGRTNLVQDSEDVLEYSIKIKTNYPLNQIVAPDGTTTADKIYNDTTTGEHYIEDALSSGLSGNFTHSVFVKAAEYTKVVLRPVHIGESTNTSVCTFDLSNETATTPTGIGSNASIQKFPNGWYRISMTLTLTGANTYNAFRLHLRENESFILNYTGDGTSGFYIWGAQVEQGSFPTSYIPTQASTRTRAADNVSMTGTNFSDWYNQSEGTFITLHRQDDTKDLAGNYGIYSLSNSPTNTDKLRFFSGAGRSPVFNVVISNSTVAYINVNSLLGIDLLGREGELIKSSIRYSDIEYSAVIGGRDLATDNTDVVIPSTLNNMIIGAGGSGLKQLCGHISQLTYFPKRLPNEQLQALTR